MPSIPAQNWESVFDANEAAALLFCGLFRRNLLGDGCMETADGGLSLLGHVFIAEGNRLHVLLDLSHAGARTISEGIAASCAPMAITHTGCRALVDLPRNTHDKDLKVLAERGGVAGRL